MSELRDDKSFARSVSMTPSVFYGSPEASTDHMTCHSQPEVETRPLSGGGSETSPGRKNLLKSDALKPPKRPLTPYMGFSKAVCFISKYVLKTKPSNFFAVHIYIFSCVFDMFNNYNKCIII